MTRVCGRCGQPADGYAAINDTWYCHPDDETKPDCYTLAQRDGVAVDYPVLASDVLEQLRILREGTT